VPAEVRRVAVVGAGIGGLMSALALQRKGIQVTLFERDSTPPQGVTPADSMAWLRRGVPQSLHPHFFMGRLRLLLEARYPDLVAQLFAAGAGENCLVDYLHPVARARYRPRAGDARLRSLNVRRTTFEMIVRRYVNEQPGVRFNDAARVIGLETEATAPVRVTGIRVAGAEGTRTHPADAVIDASGRFSKLTDELERIGVMFASDQRDSGIWYFTRHYRLKPGQTYPASFGLPGATFDDFVVGALPADNGAFTVTFQIYRNDRAVATALREPEHFQTMCESIGVLAPWVDPARAEPTSGVHGFGQMDSFWRRSVIDGVPGVLDFYCVGDSCVRSNPKFGRGCTWSALAAHELADLLAADLTPEQRIGAYERFLENEFRADWKTMRQLDRATEAGFEIATGRRRATPGERVAQRFNGWLNEALVTEPDLFREVWAGYHGLQGMSEWMRRPSSWLGIVRARLHRPRYRDLLAVQQARPDRALLAG